jgi:hypothetical protein
MARGKVLPILPTTPENKAGEAFEALSFSPLREKVRLAKELRLHLDIAVACQNQKAIAQYQLLLSNVLATLLKYEHAQLKAVEVAVAGSIDLIKRTAAEVDAMSDAELAAYAKQFHAIFTQQPWSGN